MFLLIFFVLLFTSVAATEPSIIWFQAIHFFVRYVLAKAMLLFGQRNFVWAKTRSFLKQAWKRRKDAHQTCMLQQSRKELMQSHGRQETKIWLRSFHGTGTFIECCFSRFISPRLNRLWLRFSFSEYREVTVKIPSKNIAEEVGRLTLNVAVSESGSSLQRTVPGWLNLLQRHCVLDWNEM